MIYRPNQGGAPGVLIVLVSLITKGNGLRISGPTSMAVSTQKTMMSPIVYHVDQ